VTPPGRGSNEAGCGMTDSPWPFEPLLGFPGSHKPGERRT